MKSTLKEKFSHLTDDDFDTHESDLYVRDYPGIAKYLQSMNVSYSVFVSEVDGKQWLDLPFQNKEFWEKKAKNSAH